MYIHTSRYSIYILLGPPDGGFHGYKYFMKVLKTPESLLLAPLSASYPLVPSQHPTLWSQRSFPACLVEPSWIHSHVHTPRLYTHIQIHGKRTSRCDKGASEVGIMPWIYIFTVYIKGGSSSNTQAGQQEEEKIKIKGINGVNKEDQ